MLKKIILLPILWLVAGANLKAAEVPADIKSAVSKSGKMFSSDPGITFELKGLVYDYCQIKNSELLIAKQPKRAHEILLRKKLDWRVRQNFVHRGNYFETCEHDDCKALKVVLGLSAAIIPLKTLNDQQTARQKASSDQVQIAAKKVIVGRRLYSALVASVMVTAACSKS